MQKFKCYICNRCRKILWYVGCEKPEDVVTIKKDNIEYHYCKEHAPKNDNDNENNIARC